MMLNKQTFLTFMLLEMLSMDNLNLLQLLSKQVLFSRKDSLPEPPLKWTILMFQLLSLLHLNMELVVMMKKLPKLNLELKIFLPIIKNSNLLNGNIKKLDQMAATAMLRFS